MAEPSKLSLKLTSAPDGKVVFAQEYLVTDQGLKLVEPLVPKPEIPLPPVSPAFDLTITGFKRNKYIDSIRQDRFTGKLNYPGTMESRVEVTRGKDRFMNQANNNIYRWQGPFMNPPMGTPALYDSPSGAIYPGGSIINGTPKNERIPVAPAPSGSWDFRGNTDLGYAASWAMYNENIAEKKEEVLKVKNLVRDRLLYWSAAPGLNFKNRVRYNADSFDNSDFPPGFGLGIFVIICLHCFDRVKSSFSSAQRTQFLNFAADYAEFSLILQKQPFDELFTKSTVRNGDLSKYVLAEGYNKPNSTDGTCYSKPVSPRTAKRYNNRRMGDLPIYYILAHIKKHPDLYGTIDNNRDWSKEGYTLFMEHLAYVIFPASVGVDGEENRNSDTAPSQGLNYAYTRMGFACQAIGFAVQDGDLSLLNAETAFGANGTEVPKGEPAKSLKRHLEVLSKRMRGEGEVFYGCRFDPDKFGPELKALWASDLDGQVDMGRRSDASKGISEILPKKLPWPSYVDMCVGLAEDLFDSDIITGQMERRKELGYRPFIPLTQNPRGTGGNTYYLGAFGSATGPIDLEELGMRPYRKKRYPLLP